MNQDLPDEKKYRYVLRYYRSLNDGEPIAHWSSAPPLKDVLHNVRTDALARMAAQTLNEGIAAKTLRDITSKSQHPALLTSKGRYQISETEEAELFQAAEGSEVFVSPAATLNGVGGIDVGGTVVRVVRRTD